MLGRRKGVSIEALASRINDQELFEEALNEIEQNRADSGLWTKALSDNGGRLDASKATYIQLSVQAKKDEYFLKEVLNLKKEVSSKSLKEITMRASVRDRYATLAEELAVEDIKKGLWAKALSISEGDEERATYAYMKLRVENMMDIATLELSKSIKNTHEEEREETVVERSNTSGIGLMFAVLLILLTILGALSSNGY